MLWGGAGKRAGAGEAAASATGNGNGSVATAATSAAAAAASSSSANGGVSSDEVAAEHLIVGVLLFTPLIALLPTTAAFYAAASLAHGATAFLRLLLIFLARQLVLNPLAYAAARRAVTPRLFPGDLSVSALRPVDDDDEEEEGEDGGDGAAVTRSRSPAPRCYLLGNRPLHYSQLLHGVALAPALLPGGADGARASVARALDCFWTGRPFGFLL